MGNPRISQFARWTWKRKWPWCPGTAIHGGDVKSRVWRQGRWRHSSQPHTEARPGECRGFAYNLCCFSVQGPSSAVSSSGSCRPSLSSFCPVWAPSRPQNALPGRRTALCLSSLLPRYSTCCHLERITVGCRLRRLTKAMPSERLAVTLAPS